MPAARLVLRGLLDPRESAAALARPIADAVNIPCSQLPERTHELPPKNRLVRVAAVSASAGEAVAWLRSVRRRAEAVPDFEFGTGRTSDTAERDSDDIGRLWSPNAFLADRIGELTPGSALDLACGTGRDAVFLASCGWDVTGVDVLADALERARDLARRCAPAIRPIRWVQTDLEAEDESPASPLPVDRKGVPLRYDLIVGFRYLHRPLFRRLRDWLTPGGSVIYETFTTQHRERFGKPSRDSYLLEPGELPKLLADFQIRHSSEGLRDDAYTARVWATRA